MPAVQYTVPWAMERICHLLGQSVSNLSDPYSDLNGRHLLEVFNSQYQLLSSNAMAKGHPHLLRWANVTVDDNGHVEDWRWNQMRGDLIGLHPRRNADDVTPDQRERRNFASMHQMGYGLSDWRNTEYEFDSAGRIRVFNSRHKWFRVWYLRNPSPLISGVATRAYEAIDFATSGGLDYEWDITSEQSDFSDEMVWVWDKSRNFRLSNTIVTLDGNAYRISAIDTSGVTYPIYELQESPPGTFNYVQVSSKTPGSFRFVLYDQHTGEAITPYPITGPSSLTQSEWNALKIGGLFGFDPGDTVPNGYIAPSGGALKFSIMPWFPPRFVELLIYRTIFSLKRVSNHQLFMKEETEWQAAFDQWLERFDQASVPQTGLDPNAPSLTEGDSIGSYLNFNGGW